jgi:hypothetical protein
MAKEHRLGADILAKAEKLGIYGATAEARILQMAKLGARITHPDATHRFRQFIMTIQPDGLLTSLDRMTAEEEQYYTRRKYDDRRVDEHDTPTPLGEAIVTPKVPK